MESKAVGSWNFGIGGFSKSSSGNFKHHQTGNSERKGRTSVIEIPRFRICGILHPESVEIEEKDGDTKIKSGIRLFGYFLNPLNAFFREVNLNHLDIRTFMTNVWKRYREILQNLKSHQPLLFYMHIFFVGAATLTLLIVILSSVREL